MYPIELEVINLESLKLDNQLCFKIYATSRQITKAYKPLLDSLNLTYPQYLVMLVLWEVEEINVKKLGEKLFLDSGTLTPLLKKMEVKGYLERKRDVNDERIMNISLTILGRELRVEAQKVPETLVNMNLVSIEEYELLMGIFNRFLEDGGDND